MTFVTARIALGLFVVVLIVAIGLSIWLGSFQQYETSKLHTFVAILSGFAIFITFMFYYSVVDLQQEQQALTSLNEIARVHNSITTQLMKNLTDSAPIIPNFVCSVDPLNSATCYTPTTPDPVNADSCARKSLISFQIFSIWQDVIRSRYITTRECSIKAYINLFLQQANSQQLYSQWNIKLNDFDCDTQTFASLLFEYALPITEQTPAAYLTATEALMSTDTYKQLFV